MSLRPAHRINARSSDHVQMQVLQNRRIVDIGIDGCLLRVEGVDDLELGDAGGIAQHSSLQPIVEDYGVAQSAFQDDCRSVSPGGPRMCPTTGQTERLLVDPGRILPFPGPMLVQVGHFRASVGPSWTNFGPVLLLALGQVAWSTTGQCCANASPMLGATSSQCRSSTSQMWSVSVHVWSNLAVFGPNLIDSGPSLVVSEPCLVEFGRSRALVECVSDTCANLGRTSASCSTGLAPISAKLGVHPEKLHCLRSGTLIEQHSVHE